MPVQRALGYWRKWKQCQAKLHLLKHVWEVKSIRQQTHTQNQEKHDLKTPQFISFRNMSLETQLQYASRMINGLSASILVTTNTVFHHRGRFCPRLRMHRMNIFLRHVRQTHSGFHRHYAQMSAKFLILLKKAQLSWMCFITLNDLYTAHHNSFGIHVISSKSVICMEL